MRNRVAILAIIIAFIAIGGGVVLGGVAHQQFWAWVSTAVGAVLGGVSIALRTTPIHTAARRSSRATPAYWFSFVLGLAVYIIGGIEHGMAFVVLLPLLVVSLLGAIGAQRLERASDEMYWKGTEASRQLAVAWGVLILWGAAGLLAPGNHANGPLINTVIAFVLFGVVIFAAGSGVSNYVTARRSIVPIDTSEAEIHARRKAAWAQLNRFR